jgi:predicted flap endonuclease-1-like 5' DNA nuclease
MEILKRFLCDWGSSDSNMLLFFLLVSYLLGLLTGWLIWGRKIEAMLQKITDKDTTIADINAKLLAKEAEANTANANIQAMNLIIKQHEEEKGQLRTDLASSQELGATLRQELDEATALIPVPIPTALAVGMAISPELDINNTIEEKTTVENTVGEVVETPPVVEEAVIEDNIVAEILETPTVAMETAFTTEKIAEETPQNEEETASAPIRTDDLKKIEGIGPKIAELCNGIGIFTWKQLSETSVETLQTMLDNAGKRYQIHNPSTWPAQALMAHEGRFDELKVYQDHLKGGKEV